MGYLQQMSMEVVDVAENLRQGGAHHRQQLAVTLNKGGGATHFLVIYQPRPAAGRGKVDIDTYRVSNVNNKPIPCGLYHFIRR